MNAPARLVVLVAGLAACTEANPLDLDPRDDDTGAAGSAVGNAATQPVFEPHDPALPATGGGAVGGPASGGSGSPGAGGTAVGTGGAAAGTGGAAAGTGGAGGRPAPTGGAGATAGRVGSGPGSIQVIDDLVPVAISDTGVVVTGHRAGRPIRWTAMTGPILLPLGRVAHTSGLPTAMSADGLVIVGSSGAASRSEAVSWLGPMIVQPLGFARVGDDSSEAIAVSGDGKIIAGTSENASAPFGGRQQAFIWRASGNVMMSVPLLPGDTGSEALALSRDGSTVVGLSYDVSTNPPRQRAFWWKEGAVTAEVSAAPGAALMVPRAVSADGSVVVGDAFFGKPNFPGVTDVVATRAFRWTRAGGTELAPVNIDREHSRSIGVSSNGAVIVGLAFTSRANLADLPMPFRWQPPSTDLPYIPPGDLPVATIVTDDLGSTIVGVAQTYTPGTVFISRAQGPVGYNPAPHDPLPPGSDAVALSRDGRVLLGRGRNAIGDRPVAWLLTLP